MVETMMMEAGLGPANAVKVLAVRYKDYVEEYSASPANCGKEKLLLCQAASYLYGVTGVKVEGITLTLSFTNRKKFVIPASEFYS
jgi:hypothetical protein